MAYLNVKEWRLEAKIAYVGAPSSGRGTNFDRLGDTRIVDDRLALFWQPKTELSFRDCSVRAELITARGEITSDVLRELVRISDGIVFVADAAPAAQDRNREALVDLRAALAEVAHPVPVLVQVNKADVADETDALRQLDVDGWPHVEASATSGHGVAETVERALDLVLETLGRRDTASMTEAAPPAPSKDGNPLLAALRQVLRETVAGYVEEVEKRAQPKLDRILDELAQQQRELAKVRSSLATVSAAVSALSDTTEGMTLESVACAKQVAEIARAVEALTGAEREQQALLGGAKRALEAMPSEVKTALQSDVRTEVRAIDPRAAIYAVKGEIERLGDQLHTSGIESHAAVLRTFGELDAKTSALGVTLDALIEELKKPKKGWFG